MIINDKIREVIILHHHINNYFYNSQSINSDLDRLIIHYFGQTVNNKKNQIVVVIFLIDGYWQTCETID